MPHEAAQVAQRSPIRNLDAEDLEKRVVAEAENEVDPVAGEIVLAPGFITRRCRGNAWPEELEMPMLVVHGLMHILGWDHHTDAEAEAMEEREAEHLATIGLERR